MEEPARQLCGRTPGDGENGLIGIHEAGAELIVARLRPEVMRGGHQDVLDGVGANIRPAFGHDLPDQ